MTTAQDILKLLEAKQPKEIKSIWDNGGKTIDRYTVILDGSFGEMALGLSKGGKEFSGWSEAIEGDNLGKKIKWNNLDRDTQDHIIMRLKED